MKTIGVAKWQAALIHAADTIIDNEPYLTEVDTIIGDGDHGIGMKRGFCALKKLLEANTYPTMEALCKATGMELVKTMGGASGVIFGTLFIGGLKELGDGNAVSLQQLTNYLDAGCEAIQRRGKARAGQKTMLDALIPAVEALKVQAAQDADIETAFDDAQRAAKEGVEASKSMKSQTGRSKNFQDATIGLPDPGAISTSLIFQALYESIKA